MDSDSSRRSSTSWTSKVSQLFHHRGQFVHFAFDGFFFARLFLIGVRVFFCIVCISFLGCVTPCLPVLRSAKPIFEAIVRCPIQWFSIWSGSFLLTDYGVREELDQSTSNSSEIEFAFSGPQHTLLLLLGQTALLEEMPAHVLELDI